MQFAVRVTGTVYVDVDTSDMEDLVRDQVCGLDFGSIEDVEIENIDEA